MIKKIDHLVITTSQPAHCISFYEKLGFTSKKSGERYELFSGDFKINVHVKDHELLPHAAHIQPGSADLCFEISEPLASFVALIEQQGLAVELGVVERTGVRGAMQSVYLRDPDGNLVEFCSYE